VLGVFLDRDSVGIDLEMSSLETLDMDWQFYPYTDPGDVVTRCQNAEIIVTNKVVLSADTIAALPNLKLIVVAATGTNNVDLVAAKSRNIPVRNVVDYAGSSIAQLVFSYILEFATQSANYQRLVEEGKWASSKTFCLMDYPMFELAGKTLLLVGYGNLARSVEKIARAFDMEVVIAEHKGASSIRQGRVAFDQAIQSADVISLHCPLTDNTHHLFSTAEFSQMKPTAILINTARGGIVDESALIDALKRGEIAGAATDVVSQEPAPKDLEIIREKPYNLIVTPHIAWASLEARQRLLSQIVEHCASHLSN